MKMLRGCLSLLITSSVLFVINTVAMRWSETPSNGAVMYPCSGRDISLEWNYTLDSGDVVTSTVWNFQRQGASQEVVAMSVHGNFLPTARFVNRATFKPSAGILLSNATPADSGTYSVLVMGRYASRNNFIYNKTVVIQVSDALMTDAQELHVKMEPAAVRVPATDQWAISLACGHFTYADNPPIDVDWKTPDGKTLTSTKYEGGYFKLHLPGPVVGGVYTCGISSSMLSGCGLQGHNIEATVQLDAIAIRLALFEAERKYLRAENSRKDAVISNLTSSLNAVGSWLADGYSRVWKIAVPVRLVNGANSRQGRVEIKVNNEWGTVCDDGWDNNDAKVVCRTLGFPSEGARARNSAQFGQGRGSIHLDDVRCTGNEAHLTECSSSPLGRHDCSHSEDAGVICS